MHKTRTPKEVLELASREGVQIVDLKFIDWPGQWQHTSYPLHELDLVYPDLVFEETLRLSRGDRTIEIRHLGQGNTAGDAIVWLPEERVLITGDVVVHPIPFAFDVSRQYCAA